MLLVVVMVVGVWNGDGDRANNIVMMISGCGWEYYFLLWSGSKKKKMYKTD